MIHDKQMPAYNPIYHSSIKYINHYSSKQLIQLSFHPILKSVFQMVHSLHLHTMPLWIFHPYQRQRDKLIYYLVWPNTISYKWDKCVTVDVPLHLQQTISPSYMAWPQFYMYHVIRIPAFDEFPLESLPRDTHSVSTRRTVYLKKINPRHTCLFTCVLLQPSTRHLCQSYLKWALFNMNRFNGGQCP
jgi:hypothetical protein